MEFSEFSKGPWIEIGGNGLIFRGQPYFLVIDYYYKCIEEPPVQSQTSFYIIATLREIFSCFGACELAN